MGPPRRRDNDVGGAGGPSVGRRKSGASSPTCTFVARGDRAYKPTTATAAATATPMAIAEMATVVR